uniref:KIAA0319-like C-terminal domain-containing protein n=1 Tax=Oncorhynchus tshawytscha TaxID=74940 RepID=A0A8C8G767_ONCTS
MGTYLFQLRVTDTQGRSSTATATMEVRPDPGGREEVEVEMLVALAQVSVSQKDTVLRQLAALLQVLDNGIHLRGLWGHSDISTVLRFSVQGPEGPVPGPKLAILLQSQLLREKTEYLLFRVLRVDTWWVHPVLLHGHCLHRDSHLDVCLLCVYIYNFGRYIFHIYIYTHKFGHTYSFKGFLYFLLFPTL